MTYLKALFLPVFVGILLTIATAMLGLLAVQQYFSGGPGQALGEFIWTSSIPAYTLWLELIAVALWAGYRMTIVAGVRVAAISSGALVFASIFLIWVLIAFIDRGASEASEFFRGPHAGLIQLMVLVIVGGAVGAWLRERKAIVT